MEQCASCHMLFEANVRQAEDDTGVDVNVQLYPTEIQPE